MSGPASTGPDMTVWANHVAAPGAAKLTYRVHYAHLSRDASASRVVMPVAAPDGAKLVRAPHGSAVLIAATEVGLDLIAAAEHDPDPSNNTTADWRHSATDASGDAALAAPAVGRMR